MSGHELEGSNVSLLFHFTVHIAVLNAMGILDRCKTKVDMALIFTSYYDCRQSLTRIVGY